MECKYANRVMLYWSGELDHEEHDEVERHLGTCETCLALVGDLTALHGDFAALPGMTPERDLFPAAISIRKIPEKKGWWIPSPALQWVTAAIMVIAILGGAYVLLKKPEPPRLTQVNPSLPFTSTFENNLTVQMQDLQDRVDSLKDTMRGRESGLRSIVGQSVNRDRTVADIRSDVETLKHDLVETEQFPFHTTIPQHRSNSYENHQLYYYHRDYDQSWSLLSSDNCSGTACAS